MKKQIVKKVYIEPKMNIIYVGMIYASEIPTVKTIRGDFIIESQDGDSGYGSIVT